MTTGYNYLVSDDTDDIDWLPPVHTFLNCLELGTAGRRFMFYFKGRVASWPSNNNLPGRSWPCITGPVTPCLGSD